MFPYRYELELGPLEFAFEGHELLSRLWGRELVHGLHVHRDIRVTGPCGGWGDGDVPPRVVHGGPWIVRGGHAHVHVARLVLDP